MPVSGQVHPPQHFQSQQIEHYQGAVPPPALIEHFQRIVPDAGKQFFEMARAEAAHQQKLQSDALAANIETQAKQVALAEQQTRSGIFTDRMGLVGGVMISAASIAGAIYLGLHGAQAVGCALVALPTASVLMALRGRNSAEPPKSQDQRNPK